MDNLDLHIAKKVRYYRNKFGWPLKTLAANLGISLQQLQRYESAVNKIPSSALYQIALAFKIDLNCFFDGYNANDESASDDVFKILLIEDNTDDEFFFRKSINDFHKILDIYVLKNGNDVLHFFRTLNGDGVPYFKRPDIIFLDLNLPNLSGFDILQDIKKRQILHDVPVIILSSSLSDNDVTRSYHMQASGFIRKDFNFSNYKNQIHSTFNYWIDIVKLPTHQAPKQVVQN